MSHTSISNLDNDCLCVKDIMPRFAISDPRKTSLSGSGCTHPPSNGMMQAHMVAYRLLRVSGNYILVYREVFNICSHLTAARSRRLAWISS